MLIFPAIDLFDGQAVRLLRGDYARMTVYEKEPLSLAKSFAAQGAKCLHIVDLEGAKHGETPNFSLISQIAQNSGLFVEVGGGIRAMDTVSRYLDAGVSRVILGTAALENPEFLSEALLRYGERVAVSVDARDGFVAVRGWTEKTQTPFLDFCRTLEEAGVKTVVVTDISRDGMLLGTNRAMYETLTQTCRMNVIASGGVSSVEDVLALRAMNLYGAILGKALYEQKLRLSDALEAAL